MSKAFEKNFVRSSTFRTICEVLREIYWATNDQEIRNKVVEATTMAKKMDKKLHEYKYGWDEGEWQEITDSAEIAEARRKQYEREKK
ncbi:MAG: hypothetical protein MN733_07810 [Nitrososphaera sp.]|nr:hypothetical protein [Nitrososphaera sp.]